MPVSSKRKLDEVEEEGTSLDQRKSILDISMTKLRSTPHRKVEPSLRRSVLIFNTLKNIENQLKLEGVTVPLPDEKPNLMPAMQTDAEDVIDSIPCSSVPYAQDKCESMDQDPPYNVSCSSTLGNNSVSCNSTQETIHSDKNTCDLVQPNVALSPCGADVQFSSTNSTHPANSIDLSPHCNKTEISSSDIHESNNYYESKSETNLEIPPASTFTESLLSDTSKFILDSLLSSDKLVAVASFSSLFELESNDTTSHPSANQNNNNCYSGSQIPPFTCLSNNSNYTLTQEASMETTHGGEYQEVCNKSSQYQDLESVSSSQLNSFAGNIVHNSPTIKAVTCRQQSDSQHSVGDIDCNSFDFDLFLPSLSPSMKLTQLNHDDLVHSLPSPDMSFSNQCTAGASFCNQKTELLSDDLDHIMQILVGI